METIVKAFKFIGGVNTYIGDILDPLIEIIEFHDEHVAFLKEYLHEHPDEIDNVYSLIKCSIFPYYFMIKRGQFSFIKYREKFFNDQEQFVEVIVMKRLQSREDEIWYRNIMRDEEDGEDKEDEEDEKK